MDSINHICFSEDIAPYFKDGADVILHEKIQDNLTNIPTRIINLTEIDDDYKFNLVNITTNKILTKKTGEQRAWYLKKALASGTVSFPESDDILLCPSCNKYWILHPHTICLNCKREEKKNFFTTKVAMDGEPFFLDDEQVDAVLADRNALVTARAGSGKTRVLTAKLIDLFYNQGVRQDEVIAFCFNREASREIQERLTSRCTVDNKSLFSNYDVVTTFHSYAVGIVKSKIRDILTDENTHNRTFLIKQIIKKLRFTKPKFEQCIREFFLENTLKVDRQNFKNIEEYYTFIHNSRYRTLNNEQVRSIPEKIIADFLFKHQIKYQYEPRFYLGNIDFKYHNLTSNEHKEFLAMLNVKNETIPDFYLPEHDMIWEHWGVNGNESSSEKENFTKEVCNYNEYMQNMKWKQSFWNDWRFKIITSKHYKKDFSSIRKLIETNPNDFNLQDREKTEANLKNKLEAIGIPCVKLPEEELIKRVWEKAEDHFTSQIRQFIDKFQQQYIDNPKVFEEKARLIEDEREKSFLRVGYMVYREYIRVLNGEAEGYNNYKRFNYDYNLCLYDATKEILSGIYDNQLCQLKWILIDEYQDFSELFFNLVKAILSRNPNIKLFCVGDDWQAINRFAGSDLKYFNNFSAFFPNGLSYNITTNYRSEDHIVSEAGLFMQRFGITGKTQKGFLENTGVFEERFIWSVKQEDIPKYEWLFKDSTCWAISDDPDSNHTSFYKQNIMGYIKTCADIINQNPGKKIMLLNRKNRFLGKGLDEIERILRNPKLCVNKNARIEVKTVHQSKGEEADIVILTEIDENHFPIFHPDTNLYGIFGELMETQLEDEARLYYVALTRAKHSIYILYSIDSPSVFIKKPYIKKAPQNFYQLNKPSLHQHRKYAQL